MRDDLLKRIAALKDVQHVFILTHDIDFLFLQSLAGRALAACGNPTVTVFAERECALGSYRSQRSLLTSVGQRFLVLPVSMGPHFRFHPKLILLTSREEGFIFIGSGNLTFGGWRDNAEIWTHFRSSIDPTDSFAAARVLLERLVSAESNGQLSVQRLRAAFDNSQQWAAAMEAPGSLVYRLSGDRPLLTQIIEVAPTSRVTGLRVCAPYFDESGSAVRELWEAYNKPPLTVYVPNKGSNITSTAIKNLTAIADVRHVAFRRELLGSGAVDAFVHAKFLAVELGDSVAVFVGSANASRAALTLGGSIGNAECLTAAIVSQALFAEMMHGELVILETEVTPGKPDQEPTDADDHVQAASLHVLRAIARDGQLEIAFTASEDVHDAAVILDDENAIGVELARPGVLAATLPARKKPYFSCRIIATINGCRISSAAHWIDDEAELQTSTARRTIRDILSGSKVDIAGDAKQWTLLLRHLATAVDPGGHVPGYGPKRRPKEAIGPGAPLSRSDLFVQTYRSGAGLGYSGYIGDSDSKVSIWTMLRHRFGLDGESHEGHDAGENGGSGIELNAENEEEETDKQEEVKTVVKKKQVDGQMSAADRKRNAKLLAEMAKVLVTDTYLAAQQPRRLGDDLTVAGILFRIGRSAGWIDAEEYASLTIGMLQPLFLARSKAGVAGALSQEFRLREDPQKSIEEFSSPELAAVIVAWIAATPLSIGQRQAGHLFFLLLSVAAHVPWICPSADPELALRHLRGIANDTPAPPDSLFADTKLRELWDSVTALGGVLQDLEAGLGSASLDALRSCLPAERCVQAGELTWQSTAAGFCITLADSFRWQSADVPVLTLAAPEARKTFKSGYLVPVLDVLQSEGALKLCGIGDNLRKAVLEGLLPALSESGLTAAVATP